MPDSSPVVAAFFDVDGTLTRTTLLQPLAWYQRAQLSRPRYLAWLAGLLVRIPHYLWIDRRSRAAFNILFFQRYRGLSAGALRDWHRQTFADNLQRVIFPEALAQVQAHRQQGHRIVLVTGGLDFVIQPLAEYLQADAVMAMRLIEEAGTFTGLLQDVPIADEQKATLVQAYAADQGVDLAQSYAYGNSVADAPMLACVGHPVAVNPDGRLRRLAAARGWPVVRWSARKP